MYLMLSLHVVAAIAWVPPYFVVNSSPLSWSAVLSANHRMPNDVPTSAL